MTGAWPVVLYGCVERRAVFRVHMATRAYTLPRDLPLPELETVHVFLSISDQSLSQVQANKTQ